VTPAINAALRTKFCARPKHTPSWNTLTAEEKRAGQLALIAEMAAIRRLLKRRRSRSLLTMRTPPWANRAAIAAVYVAKTRSRRGNASPWTARRPRR
jgi:hypothetical protein